MKIKIYFLNFFIFFIKLNLLTKAKENHQQEDVCSSCYCKIEDYRKTIKDLEALLKDYRKENVDLMKSINNTIITSAEKTTKAYESYDAHLRKYCSSK